MMDTVFLPEPGYSRLKTILRIFPISRSRWYAAISEGRIDAPVRIGPNSVAWSNQYINGLLRRVARGERIL